MPTDGGQSDEISLVGLGLVLWRRRRAVLTTVAAVALGVLFALLFSSQCAYTTTVELGSHV